VSKSDLRIDWATHAAAKYACENWHYSGCTPSTFTKLNKIGVWESKRFIGCVVFSLGSNKNIGSPYGLCGGGSVCELVRVALSKHVAKTSRIVAIAIRFLRKRYQALRLIVSYAAADQGHVGTIYQAGNWVYVGTVRGGDSFIVNGRKMLNRAVDASGINKAGLKKIDGTTRHKYLMPLDDEMRKQIEPLRKPYPKRVRSVDSDTATVQVAEGGANPTRTLNESKEVTDAKR
jgi:hypothetical protein